MKSGQSEFPAFGPPGPTARGPIQVGLLCPAELLYARLAEVVRAGAELSVWSTEEPAGPDVVLCAAESGGGLRGLRRSPLLSPWPKAVLYDLAGMLGALGAGLHGFRGYCPPGVSAERLLRCLRRVAAGERDAPRPHYETLLRVLDAPPLDDRDRKILGLLALGAANARIERELPIKDRTLRNRLARLELIFEAEDRVHLAAVAVALDLGWPWEGEPPSGWLIGGGGGYDRAVEGRDEPGGPAR